MEEAGLVGKRSARGFVALVSGALLVGLLSVPASAAPVTRWVDDDGHAGAAGCASSHTAPKTIQAAVDMSGAGDTVLVCPGTYPAQVAIEGAAKNGLKVRSVKPRKAIIRAPALPIAAAGPAAALSDLVRIDGVRGASLQAFKLIFPTAPTCTGYRDAIEIGGASRQTSIRGNLVTASGSDTFGDTNGCGYQVGVDVAKGPGTHVTHNTFRDFQLTGVALHGVGSPSISKNQFKFLHAAEGTVAPDCASGISIANGSTPMVSTNTIVGLASAGTTTAALCDGLDIKDAGSTFVAQANLIRYADSGIQLLFTTGGTVDGNTIRNSRIYGISLLSVDSTDILDNQVHGTQGIGILVDDHTHGADLRRNDVTNNGNPDCFDASTGGAAGAPHYGTKNTWVANLGEQADPSGICHHP